MRERWCQVSFAAIAFVLLWLDLFFLPLSPVSPDLDPSWCGALIHFSALKLQFGRDIVFTYGPLAHLTSFVYTGELFTTRVIYEFVSKTVFTAILGLTILFLPKLWRPIFFLFVLLFIWVDPISDALYFLVIVCASAVLFRQRDYPVSFLILVGILFGVCSLIKFTYLLLALLALGLVSVSYLLERRPLRAITLGGSFIGAFLLAWHLAGQEFSSLVFYLINSIDVALGYKEAMGSPVSSNWILAAGVAALVLGLVQCGYLFKHSRRLSTLCLVLFFAGTAWLSWTRAFVRADDHVLSFFGLFPAASLALWVPAEPRRLRSDGSVIRLTCLFSLFVSRESSCSNLR